MRKPVEEQQEARVLAEPGPAVQELRLAQGRAVEPDRLRLAMVQLLHDQDCRRLRVFLRGDHWVQTANRSSKSVNHRRFNRRSQI